MSEEEEEEDGPIALITAASGTCLPASPGHVGLDGALKGGASSSAAMATQPLKQRSNDRARINRKHIDTHLNCYHKNCQLIAL